MSKVALQGNVSGTGTVTIAAPNTNVNRTLSLPDVDGTLLSSDVAGNVTATGDVILTGTGKRITGDFSNATTANRVLFQTSTVNGNTLVGAMPNGTGTQSMFRCESTTDPNNSSSINMTVVHGVDTRLVSSATGTGTYLPMTFHTGGSERMRIDTSGNVQVSDDKRFCFGGANNGWSGGTAAKYLYAITDNTERLRIDSSGNVLVTNSSGGLGYGTGAGGTVTQATSKATGVTLNKPCGQITMNNAALAAGASVIFAVNNTLVTATDVPQVSLGNVGSGLAYTASVTYTAANVFYIRVTNISVGSLSEAVVINFAIIKGANS